ncbi:MAG: hypothetical protein AAGE94_24910, partial [Acidobacteriota bacterium]
PPPPPPPEPPPGPPESLQRAVVAHLAGDYAAVDDLLADAETLRSKQARAHALLLRAASRYARYLLDGEGDPALRGRAVADIAAVRALDAALEPPIEVFSPRFRDFFASIR